MRRTNASKQSLDHVGRRLLHVDIEERIWKCFEGLVERWHSVGTTLTSRGNGEPSPHIPGAHVVERCIANRHGHARHALAGRIVGKHDAPVARHVRIGFDGVRAKVESTSKRFESVLGQLEARASVGIQDRTFTAHAHDYS